MRARVGSAKEEMMAKSAWKVLASAALLQLGAAAPPARALAQVPPPAAAGGTAPASSFWVEMSCSRTHPGVVTATIKWRAPATPSARSGAAPRSAQPQSAEPVLERVDVATSPTGFQRNSFLTVWPLQRAGRPGLGASSSGNHELDPLVELRVTPPPKRTAPRNRSSIGPPSPPRGGIPLLAADQLVPGVNYFWQVRSWTPQGDETISVVGRRAPSCPVDPQTKR